MSFLLTILAFGLLIVVHELGHFLAARAFGVQIETFSIGFGKPLVNFERGGTNYRISWLPLGGYVKMKGDNPDDEAQEPDTYYAQSWWKRVLIAAAGPAANLILALLIFIISFLLPQSYEDHRPVIGSASVFWNGVFAPGDSILSVNERSIRGYLEALSSLYADRTNTSQVVRKQGDSLLSIPINIPGSELDTLFTSLLPLAEPIVGEVTPGYPAWQAGLKAGDRVLSVDSTRVDDWYSMRELIANNPSTDVLLQVQRGDSLLSRRIKLEANLLDDQGSRMIGISLYMPVSFSTKYSAPEAISNGFVTTIRMIGMNYYGLWQLLKNPRSLQTNIGGPVMIVSMSQSVAQRGLGALLPFFAGISILLMIMNLLPIPILDGGHIMFFIIEGIIRRPVPVRVQEIAQRIGFSLLLVLMVFAFYADISKLVFRLINGA